MDEGSRCERCPLYGDDPIDEGRGLLCAGVVEYPLWIEDGDVRVRVGGPDDFPVAMAEFTNRFFSEIMKNPGVKLDPRAFLRVKTQVGGRPRSLCPFSYPVEQWAQLALEQVLMDTGGMQVRYLRNDLSWLEQPAIYTDVVGVVQEARSVANTWLEDRKKEKK